MEISVENIKCNGCANSIKNALSKFDGVNSVDIDVENGLVKIDSDDSMLDRVSILEKLKSMGYPEPGNGSILTTASSYVSCMVGRVTS